MQFYQKRLRIDGQYSYRHYNGTNRYHNYTNRYFQENATRYDCKARTIVFYLISISLAGVCQEKPARFLFDKFFYVLDFVCTFIAQIKLYEQ